MRIMKRINCRRCKHYYVTWESSKPHGCRAYGFKSPQIPSMVVFKSSGVECALFSLKPTPKS
jgi:hypothetical protein